MHGETGPTTLLRLCERSRMNWVCRLLLVSGTPLDFPQMAASRTSSDVGLPKSSMVAFPCSLPWDTLRPTLVPAEMFSLYHIYLHFVILYCSIDLDLYQFSSIILKQTYMFCIVLHLSFCHCFSRFSGLSIMLYYHQAFVFVANVC